MSRAISKTRTPQHAAPPAGGKRRPIGIRLLRLAAWIAIIAALTVAGGYVIDAYLDYQYETTVVRAPVASADASGRISYSSILSGDELELYRSITGTMQSNIICDSEDQTTWILLPRDSEIPLDRMVLIWQMSMNDNPLTSVYATGGDQAMVHATSTAYCLETPATKEDGIQGILDKKDASKSACDAIAEQAWSDANGDTWQYVRNVYFRIAKDVEYTYNTADTHYNDIYGCAVERASQCHGFALAMKYALDLHDVPNFIATGAIDGTSHAWNVVKADGEWLVCDLTSGSATYRQAALNGLEQSEIEAYEPYAAAMWSYCLIPQDEYLETQSGIMDDVCYELEASMASEPADAGAESSSANGDSMADEATGAATSTDGLLATICTRVAAEYADNGMVGTISGIVSASERGWSSVYESVARSLEGAG